MQPFFIGVAGQMRAGKDTIADYLVESLKNFDIRFERGAFAKNVKRIYCETFQVDYDFIEQWKTNPDPPPGFDMNVRSSLQFIGDGFRKIKSSIWLELMFRTDKDTIISDVRYINEAQGIADRNGLNILVARPDRMNNDPNGSEAQIRPYAEWCLTHMTGSGVPANWDGDNRPEDLDLFSYFIRNDGSLGHLYSVLDKELIPFIVEKLKGEQ